MSTPRKLSNQNGHEIRCQCIACREPARPSDGSVTCSDLICELEAALRDTSAQWREYTQEQMDEPIARGHYEDMIALKRVVEIMRGRSQIGEHSNTPEPRA